jgi:hypothetical protein
MVEVDLQELPKPESLRSTTHECDVVDRKVVFERRESIELLEYGIRPPYTPGDDLHSFMWADAWLDLSTGVAIGNETVFAREAPGADVRIDAR